MNIRLNRLGIGAYTARPHTLTVASHVIIPEAVVKCYLLSPQKRDLPSPAAVDHVRKIINFKLKHQLNLESGMGFAILSEDTLNVSLWKRRPASVIQPHIYSFANMDALAHTAPRELKETLVDRAGAYCVYELAVVAQERDFWLEFLKSPRKEEDKKRYLQRHAHPAVIG